MSLRGLETSHTALQLHVTEFQPLSAPIHKLPVDVLGDILSLVCNQGTGNAFGKKSHLPSLCLTAVCSFWREVMLARSDMWSSIDVHLDKMTKGSCRLLSLWLARSRDALLHLRVVSGYSFGTNSTTEWKTFSLLLNQAHRWASATLRLDFQLYVEASARITAIPDGDTNSDLGYESHPHETTKPFTHLKALDLSWFDRRIAAVRSSRPAIRLFQYAPALRFLTIRQYDDFFSLPLPQIRHLNVKNSSHSLATMLSQCSNLECLSLLNFAAREPAPEKPVRLTNLTHLEVQVSSYCEMLTTKHLFDNLELPSLTSFSITEPGHYYLDRAAWSQPAFESLLSRSSCHLQKLIFMEVTIAPEELEATLRLTPALTHLEFVEQREGQAFTTAKDLLKALSYYPNMELLVPMLSYLSIETGDSLTIIAEDVKKMVLSRSRFPDARGLDRICLATPEITSCVENLSRVICSQGTRIVVKEQPTSLTRLFPAYCLY
ncbi:hypothetical protein VNI00_015923 [Paramarasmius palmivorus]|uniref:F-box domain-containing protein n=1 Tax=Paramarasmius palmivorus TaxID=297713 RepID=A0AAW0BGM5_9AGAR